jgi:hypothetical protein
VPLQATSLLGALLILVAYAAHQAGRLGRDVASYHLLNAVGAALLLVVAIAGRQAGFILLEGVWTAISVVALWRLLRSRPAS